LRACDDECQDFALSYPLVSVTFLSFCTQVQNRRDAEIVRLKRKYLKHFVEELYGDAATVSPAPPGPVDLTKRVRQETEATPRKKFRRESLEMWRKACVTAQDIYDHDLPTLEEATLLFGFSRGISA
jgi:hypothetical protein